MCASVTDHLKRPPRGGTNPARRLPLLAVLAAFASLCLFLAPVNAGAQQVNGGTRSLGVTISFPDGGIASDEQLCVALYPGNATNLSQPPMQSRCLNAGQDAADFSALSAGDYQVVIPGPGSVISSNRYQGQRIDTSLPNDPNVDAFGIEARVALIPELRGTTGNVEVNVFGCPPGTNGGGNASTWASECNALAGGIPLSLNGIGTIHDTSMAAVTGDSGDTSGKVEFANLPAGAYRLDGTLPENVSQPALFVASSIDGSVAPLDPTKPLSVRPSETVAVNVYLVIDNGTATGADSSVGTGSLPITGGLSADDAARFQIGPTP